MYLGSWTIHLQGFGRWVQTPDMGRKTSTEVVMKLEEEAWAEFSTVGPFILN